MFNRRASFEVGTNEKQKNETMPDGAVSYSSEQRSSPRRRALARRLRQSALALFHPCDQTGPAWRVSEFKALDRYGNEDLTQTGADRALARADAD